MPINLIPTDGSLKLTIPMSVDTSKFRAIAGQRGVKVNAEETQRSEPALIKEEAQKLLVSACEKLGIRYKLMISGAAQDAQHIANYGIPAGMIFVPSKNGISHAPEEFTGIKHIAMAAKILITAITEAQNTWGD